MIAAIGSALRPLMEVLYRFCGNFGVTIIAICVHILSHLPGTINGKYCVITDDKGAAGCINGLFNRTRQQYAGAQVNLYSTPKLVQRMYSLGYIPDKKGIISILSTISESRIVVKGTMEYDFEINEKIALSIDELAEMIITPNKINILF